jgi:hypothetical protein
MRRHVVFLAALLFAASCTGVKIPDCSTGTVGVWPVCSPIPPEVTTCVGASDTNCTCPSGPRQGQKVAFGDQCAATPPTTLPGPTPAPTPTPTPTPEPPKPPSFDTGKDDPEPSNLVGGKLAENGAQPNEDFAREVGKAIDVACGSCEEGTVLTNWSSFAKTVRDVLRDRYGYGAAYNWTAGDRDPEIKADVKGLGSELAIWRGQHYESYQVVTSQKKVRRPPGAFRSLAIIAGLCPFHLPQEGYALELSVHPHGTSGQQYEATPYVKNQGGVFPPAVWTGSCRANQCDVAPEKDHANGEGCTADLCGAVLEYRVDPEGSALLNWPFPDGTRPPGFSDYAAKITPLGHGKLVARCPVSGVEGSVAF